MTATVWKGHLTFGLVSIPIRLHRAARRKTLRLHYLHPSTEAAAAEIESEGEPGSERTFERQQDQIEQPVAMARPEQALVVPGQTSAIPRAELLKGYEYEPDRYAVIRSEELRRLRLPTSTEMQILQFVRLAEIDPVYFETSYYVVPDELGEKPYGLLFEALRRTSYVGLAQVSMHGREHIVIVRSGRHGILAHTMYYADEARAESEFHADPKLVNPKELDLAETVVHALAGPFQPEQYADRYRRQLENMIAGKITAREVAMAAKHPIPARAPVIDIAEALMKTLEQARTLPSQAASVSTARIRPRRAGQLRGRRRSSGV